MWACVHCYAVLSRRRRLACSVTSNGKCAATRCVRYGFTDMDRLVLQYALLSGLDRSA